MSVCEFSVKEYGFILTNETMCLLAHSLRPEEEIGDFDSDIEDVVTDELPVTYLHLFTGEAFEVGNNGEIKDGSLSYNEDSAYYLPFEKTPLPIVAVYSSIDEMLEEVKRIIGKYLPDDFDYRSCVRFIKGTYYEL